MPRTPNFPSTGTAQKLQTRSAVAAQADKTALHIDAVAFIRQFDSSLNGHVHFFVCVIS
ncbi:MAG: hypothetical protein IPN53_23810 [Comamonadaceae bacterium]|nr:hypothetical protein [Comamonadaceae bacterium]